MFYLKDSFRVTVQTLANAVVMFAQRANRLGSLHCLKHCLLKLSWSSIFLYTYEELTRGQSYLKFTSACHFTTSHLLCGMKQKEFKDSSHKIFVFVVKPMCLHLWVRLLLSNGLFSEIPWYHGFCAHGVVSNPEGRTSPSYSYLFLHYSVAHIKAYIKALVSF